MIEDKATSDKLVRTHDEDDATIDYYNFTDYVAGFKDDYSFIEIVDVENSTPASARDSQNISTRG